MIDLVKILSSHGRLLNRLMILLNLLLLVLVARSAAELTWLLLDGNRSQVSPSVSGPVPARAGKVDAPAALPETGANIVAGLHLFGDVVVQVAPPPAPVSMVAPQTSLNLTLRGVIAVSTKDRALAIISEKGKQEDNIYAVGEQVPGEAEIREILADRVILLRNGKLETLWLEEIETAGGGVALQSRKNRSYDRDDDDDNTAVYDIPGGVINAGDGIHWQVSPRYKETQLANVGNIVKEVGIQAYSPNGVQEGYQVLAARGRSNRLLQQFDIRPGDIIYEVNGYKLSDIKNSVTAVKNVKEASELRVLLGRDGQMIPRVITIK